MLESTGAVLLVLESNSTLSQRYFVSDARLLATPEQAIANLDRVRAIIMSDHEHLVMGYWHDSAEWRRRTCEQEAAICGTTHCLAGWLQVCSTEPEIREMDTEAAGILCAPIAAKMFYEEADAVILWLENREYAKGEAA